MQLRPIVQEQTGETFMSDTMEALYAYAQKHLFPVYLCQDDIYEASGLCAQRQAELVRTALAQRI